MPREPPPGIATTVTNEVIPAIVPPPLFPRRHHASPALANSPSGNLPQVCFVIYLTECSFSYISTSVRNAYGLGEAGMLQHKSSHYSIMITARFIISGWTTIREFATG